MKLQIVEQAVDIILFGGKGYRYILEIDGKAVAWTGTMSEKDSIDEVYNKLTKYLADNCKDYNINLPPRYNSKRHNSILDNDSEVIFEQEVSDHFLKELFVSNKIKELAEDFI